MLPQVDDMKACALQHSLQCVASKCRQVGQFKRRVRVKVGHLDEQVTPIRQPLFPQLSERAHGVGQVLKNMRQGDQIKAVSQALIQPFETADDRSSFRKRGLPIARSRFNPVAI